MEIQSYKCPNCGGGLVFDPKTQKFKCEYCLSAFTEETLKEMEEAARKSEEALAFSQSFSERHTLAVIIMGRL